MVHIVTVHWKSDKWIDIQLRYLRNFVSSDFRVYAALTDVSQENYSKYYYCVDEQEKSHAIKLNKLANVVLENSLSDDDWLIFIDGDAFPIADLVLYGKELMKAYPLVAVQRFENNGDLQPHPCFCLTTTGFWKSNQGDWREGYEWLNLQGESITDVGGNLLGILRGMNIKWYPMLRSNKEFSVPVSFGVYDGVVYHHGAGFREGTTRIHLRKIKNSQQGAWLNKIIFLVLYFLGLFGKSTSFYIRLKNYYDERDRTLTLWARQLARAKIRELSNSIFKSIEEDFYFYKKLL